MTERDADYTYPDDIGGLEPTAQFSALPSRLGRHEEEDTRRTFLIDLTFSDPFAPSELKFERGDMDTALGEVALRSSRRQWEHPYHWSSGRTAWTSLLGRV